MPNPYNNKVQLADGTVLIDLSSDTLSSADQLAQGIVAHDRTGATVTGTIVIPSAGTEGTPVATKGTVSNHSISVTPSVTNVGGVIQGGTHTGTAVTVSASELVSGTYTVDSSGTKDVTNYASASIPSGTAGTPSASKGSVSNHAISVTPSVTNTTGWITGSTKTGTAVSVTASELVSGTYTVSASGTHNVTNYASASVASGTVTASATKGTVSNHSVSVTPSVTRTAGYITAGSSSGTAVTVSASELVSGSQTITENGTVDVTNLASVVVSVEGGGSGPQIGTADAELSSASSSISFTGLHGEPTSFVIYPEDGMQTSSPASVVMVVFDGTTIHGQTASTASNANASYDTGFTKSYSNGTLTVTATTARFGSNYWMLDYSYGGSSANIGTKDVQVGSGATSITFTGLDDEPIYWSCIFKSNFSTSSGYQRVMANRYNGSNIFGAAMDSSVHMNSTYWTQSYSNGSLTITSQGTNQGGYFHQPGYYQLTAVYGEIEPQEIDVVPLSVTTNGTYTAPSGTAYSPVTVNVSGGGSNVVEGTFTASTTKGQAQTVNIPYTGNGYPIFAHIEVDGGMANPENTAWYTTVQRYAVGLWCMSKRLRSTSPDYSDNTEKNQSIVMESHKNSASNATTCAVGGGTTSQVFNTSAASANSATCIRFSSKNTMSVFVASTSYGLMSGVTYRYQIQYSS